MRRCNAISLSCMCKCMSHSRGHIIHVSVTKKKKLYSIRSTFYIKITNQHKINVSFTTGVSHAVTHGPIKSVIPTNRKAFHLRFIPLINYAVNGGIEIPSELLATCHCLIKDASPAYNMIAFQHGGVRISEIDYAHDNCPTYLQME